MEHQALANWLNTEVRSDSQKILTALSEAKSHKTHIDLNETVLIGSEYSLFIHYDEVMIRANFLKKRGYIIMTKKASPFADWMILFTS